MPKLWYENILKFGVILSLFSFFIIDNKYGNCQYNDTVIFMV